MNNNYFLDIRKLFEEGNLERIKKYKEYTTYTGAEMDFSASYGHLDVVQWMHEIGIECTTWAMDLASFYGYLDVVKWLHENRKEGCTKLAMNFAAEMGNLDVVKWLHENRKENCIEEAIQFANNNNDIVAYLTSYYKSN